MVTVALASAFNSTLRGGLAEVEMRCDVAEPCHLPTLNTVQVRFLLVQETFHLVSSIVNGFVSLEK